MLLSSQKTTRLARLVQRPTFLFSSYFDNFNEKINMEPNVLYSYLNPKYHKNDKVRKFTVPLSARVQKLVQEQKFRDFKEKMIGVNWSTNLTIPDDPLWGPELPRHYVESRPVSEYFKIKPYEGTEAKPKALPAELRYKPQITQSLNLGNLHTCNAFNLIQYLLKQQQENPSDHQQNLQVFSIAEKILTPQLHEIALIDLVRLRHALLGPNRYGSLKFLKTIRSIIYEEYQTLNPQGLLAVFVTERFEKFKDVQKNILNILFKEKNRTFFTESNERLLEFIECFADYRIPEWKRKRELRVQSEDKINAIAIIQQLPIEEQIPFLNNEQKIRLMQAFFKLKLEGFKHLLYKIGTTTNQHELTPTEAIEYVSLLSKLQNGQGYITTSQLQTLKPIFLANWESYNNYDKLRIVYVYWNLDHAWEEFKVLYEAIPVEADINMLYLFSQIQITDSSAREHEVYRALMEVDIIPLPYFQKIKQFIVQGYTFKWNMLPLIDKLEETEIFTNINRLEENLGRNDDVINLGKFLVMTTPNIKHFMPVENFTMVQFGLEGLFIGIEVIHKKDIAPNGEIKKAFLARNRVLQNLGWHLIQVKWAQFSKLSINKQHKFIFSKLQQITETQEQRKVLREEEEAVEVHRLANLRQFELWNYDQHEDFIESFRPTQEDIDKIGEHYQETPELQEEPVHVEQKKKGKNS